MRTPGASSGQNVAIVLAITPSGTISARALGPKVPEEGSEVRCSVAAFRGTVVRVFGPVTRPYLAVRPGRSLKAGEAALLIGASLSVGG